MSSYIYRNPQQYQYTSHRGLSAPLANDDVVISVVQNPPKTINPKKSKRKSKISTDIDIEAEIARITAYHIKDETAVTDLNKNRRLDFDL